MAQYVLDGYGGCEGGPSSYGTNSEIGDIARDVAAEHERQRMAEMPLVERPSSSARRRETVLWQTLEAVGITPHDE